MGYYTLREYTPADIPALSALWRACFDDTAGFVRSFFTALPGMGSGVVAESGGVIAGAAYTLNGQELVCADTVQQVGYIYGVATDARFRGNSIGGALVREAALLSRRRGADIISTLPAEESLYRWYEGLIGVKKRLYRVRRCIKVAPAAPAARAAAEEYMLLRERLLAGKPHLRLSLPAIEFERELLREYGGDFFIVEDGIAGAYADGGRTVIRELIVSDPSRVETAAAAVGAALGTAECELWLPAGAGESYIAADRELPSGCVWNLSFD